ncbi:hypothetical protein HanHA300_Chr00c0015g0682561 [Helianthus annuus]|nr:hypothetical protein HanHA300_Chr00c0015g0682561 [Helianthus annuus]
MADHDGEGESIEFTPTWVVAAVCTVMVGVSLALERLLHFAGKKLKKEGRKPLYQALQKVKEGIYVFWKIQHLCIYVGSYIKFILCNIFISRTLTGSLVGPVSKTR